MEDAQRDALWEVTNETFYDAYYEEVAADRLISRWQLMDETARLAVAIAATGSAVSGWALWNQPVFRHIWAVLAGLAAVLSIVHVTLAVARRLKDWGNTRQHFAILRADLETFRSRMRVDPLFPVPAFQQDFLGYRDRYAEGLTSLKPDILLTRGFRIRAQKDLNQRLASEIVDP